MEDKLEKNGFKKPWNLSKNGNFNVRVSKLVSWIFVKEKRHLWRGFGVGESWHNLLKMRGCELGFRSCCLYMGSLGLGF